MLLGGEDHWRAYYNDAWRWRKEDPEFDKLCRSRMKNKNGTGGRPKIEAPEDWREKFAEAMRRHNGNRELAAKESPYSFRTILKMLNPGAMEYDEKLYEIVRETELSISARWEGLMNKNLDVFEEGLPDRDSVLAMDALTRIGEKIVQKYDPERWGKRVDLRMSGEVKHTHLLENKEVRLQRALEEQQKYFASKGQSVVLAIPQKTEEAIEVEFKEIIERSNSSAV